MKKLIIIDGNSLINRAFYALPPLTATDGTPSQAVYGFATMLVRLITEQKPHYFAVAFDTKAPTFRHKESELYKATRKGMPDELAIQLAPLKNLLGLMGIRCIEREGFEADDIIGTLAKNCSKSTLQTPMTNPIGNTQKSIIKPSTDFAKSELVDQPERCDQCEIECIIVTGDRDSLQLVDDRVSVMLTKRGITDVLHINKSNFEEEIGLRIDQIVDYKALSGDSSDNIPGVAGIGDKTATTLLHQFGSLENIYNNIDKVKGAVKNKLIEGRDSALLSQRLATICTDMELDCSLDSLQYDFPFSNAVRESFVKLGFRSLLKREELFKSSEPSEQTKATSTKKQIKTIKIDSLDTLKSIVPANISMLSFYKDGNLHLAFDEQTDYEIVTTTDLLGGGIDYDDCVKLFASHFENVAVKKLLFDAKPLKKQLEKLGIDLVGYEDIKLMQYLVDMTIDYSSPLKLLQAYDYNEGGAAVLCAIYAHLLDELDRLGMTKLYYEVELPLIDILLGMEQAGFKVDLNRIAELGEHFSTKMRDLTQQIYESSGYEFNVNSPKQLADVLFNKMNIPYPRKSKTYSTNAEILGEIASKHEVVELVLAYRTFFKLNNTYVEGLKKLAYPSGVVHTEFKQMVTTTGRLSSVEPNLQNIPVREDEGKVLREAFVSDEGRTFVSADYSQIELRLLAHYSGDEKLVRAYNNNEDIHTSTAAEVFGVEANQVTAQMRRDAKAVNFGIIYGISEFGLAKALKISNYKAKQFIETYFERFKSIKAYLDESVLSAKKLGYAQTILGRKRKIPELFSANYNIRSFGERAAMNMPLQGTAADIIKLAMIKVSEFLKGKSSKLILQVHDELIIDALDNEVDEIRTMLTDVMSHVVSLKVPLEVNITTGKRWSDCK